MRNSCTYLVVMVILWSCHGQVRSKPQLLLESTTITVPKDTIRFQTAFADWDAYVLSSIQPIPVKTTYADSILSLIIANPYGVIQGSGKILLCNGGQCFVYPVKLENDATGTIVYHEYRTPKTVNPDSSLQQYQLFHQIDAWRNLQVLPTKASLFAEKIVAVAPIAGTFEAQVGKPISAYYVQPGSVKTIPLAAKLDTQTHQYTITAGPLKDAFNNLIAQGTVVVFAYSDGLKTYRSEGVVRNGLASIQLVGGSTKMKVQAFIDRTSSLPIELSGK